MMPSIFYASYGAVWVLLLVQAALILVLYRHFGMAALGTVEGIQRDGLPIGEKALPLTGVTAQGHRVEWPSGPARTRFVLFAAPGCEPCEQVLPALREVVVRNPDIDVVAVVPGARQSAAQLVEKFAPPFACVAEDGGGAFSAYRVRVTPFAFVIGEDGRVRAKGLCSDRGRLEHLFDAAGMRLATPLADPVAGQVGAGNGGREPGGRPDHVNNPTLG